MSVAVTLSQLSCRRDELARAYKSRIWCAIKTRQRLKEATLFDSIHLSDINELLGTSVSEPHLTVGDLYRMERGMEDGARMVVWEGIKTNKPGVSLIAEYPNAIYLFFIPSQKSGHFYLVFPPCSFVPSAPSRRLHPALGLVGSQLPRRARLSCMTWQQGPARTGGGGVF